MSRNDLTTAHHAWESRWSNDEGRSDWLEPEPFVSDAIRLLKERSASTALDLGCGVGRHALLLAQHGFRTFGMDASEAGIGYARDAAAGANVEIDFRVGPYTGLPYPDYSFDYVLAWNVIYHGDRESVETALREIARVLRPGGIFQATMLSKRNSRFGRGTEVKPNTYVHGGEGEQAHPHFYCNSRELIHLLQNFEIIQLRDREQKESGTHHWEFIAERRSG